MSKYVLFDTETTGTEEEDRVIQIGAFIVSSNGDTEVINELCSTDKEISIEAMEIHHITPDMIKDKPKYNDTLFARKLHEELNSEENYLIAHNLPFDLSMVAKEGFENKMKGIDTLRCSRHLYPELSSHRLQYMRYFFKMYLDEKKEAGKYNINIVAHDAVSDVLVLKMVLSKLVEEVRSKFPTDNPMDKLVELTSLPALLYSFPFGKYKGEKFSDISNSDQGYLKWMIGNMSDLNEDMLFTLEYYLG